MKETPRYLKYFGLSAMVILLIAGGIGYWSNSCDIPQANEAVSEKIFTEAPYYPNLDLGISLPLDAKFILLNEPAMAGDVAELALHFTSRLADGRVTATLKLPNTIRQVSGESTWSGPLLLNETKQMPIRVAIDTEAPCSIQAQFTIEQNGEMLTRGAAYHFDLGEKDHASYETISVDGYDGATELNLIKPKKTQ